MRTAVVFLAILAVSQPVLGHDAVKGKPLVVRGEASFTFWTGFAKYKTFDNAKDAEALLSHIVEDVPAGVKVERKSLTIRLRQQSTPRHPGLRRQTIYTWQEYVIEGVWEVTIPPEWKEPGCAIGFRFPAYNVARANMKASFRRATRNSGNNPEISFKLNVFSSETERDAAISAREKAQAARSKAPWYEYALLAVIWTIFGAGALVMMFAVLSLLVGSFKTRAG